MNKLATALIATVVGFILWQIRQMRAKRQLAALDAGERCMSCNGNQMQPHGEGKARCMQCGHVTNFAAMAKVEVSNKDVADWTK